MKKFLLGASVVAGISGIAGAPAFAGSLTGASVSGIAGTDYYIYKQVGNQTVRDDSASLATVLQGSCAVVAGKCNPAGSPGGNVELAANSEKAGFDFTKNTTLSGTIGGKSIILSSLTASDWTTVLSSGKTLLDQYLTDAFNANGFSSIVSNPLLYNQAKTTFVSNSGEQRFSDPNISYVNQNDSTGKISIGLAGHFDATDLLLAGMTTTQKTLFLSKQSASQVGKPVQASEIVKVTYNGKINYLYNFTAAASGLTASDDGRSHNGEYEVTVQGDPVPVPEPSAVLGLMTVGGLFVAKRKLNKR